MQRARPKPYYLRAGKPVISIFLKHTPLNLGAGDSIFMATLTATVPLQSDSLIEQLMQTDGKAEIVDGHIQTFPMTGFKPGFAADEIYASLRLHARETGTGLAFADGKGFLCDLPNRRSFSPGAAFYTGPLSDMGFLSQPPIFAVEVRSENDYGPQAERQMTAKRADYFAAGTLVVWDVDLQHEEVIAKYTADNPMVPQLFRRGETADAREAVAGWSMSVDDLFAPAG